MPFRRRAPQPSPTPQPVPRTAEPEAPDPGLPQAASVPTAPWLTQQAPIVITHPSAKAAPAKPTDTTPPRDAPQTATPQANRPTSGSGAFSGKLIKTPIYTLRHPETGSRATLVANMHVGQPAYYQQLKEILTALEERGTMIHYEGVRPPTSEELAAASDEIRQLHTDWAASIDDARAPNTVAGLTHKRDAFTPGPNWEPHDITDLEALEFSGQKNTQAWIDQNRAHHKQLIHQDPHVVRAATLKRLSALPQQVRAGASRSDLITGDELKMQMYREAIAMAAVDLYLALSPGKDIALFWGTGHMPGFRSAFTARGYQHEDEQWITAVNSMTLGV